jgi:hypothetical protein
MAVAWKIRLAPGNTSREILPSPERHLPFFRMRYRSVRLPASGHHVTKDQTTDELSLMVAARMSEDDARRLLMACRWPNTRGQPVCPKCGHGEVYGARGRRTFRCKRCRTDVSVTSGTIFAGSKFSTKDLPAAQNASQANRKRVLLSLALRPKPS